VAPLSPQVTRRWIRPLLWGLLLAALLGVGSAAVWQQRARQRAVESRERAAALPALGTVPEFTLANRDGRLVRTADLAGAPWIADFVFTRCMSSCPMLSARMAELDRTLPEPLGIRLVSFSVDPAHDTPAVLERYARSLAASRRWLFLTGDPAALRSLTRRGFRLAVEPGGAGLAVPPEAILHSTRFVLVDAQGTIRGTYQGLDPAALRQLAADARALAEER
jgi:protein SCO1/2